MSVESCTQAVANLAIQFGDSDNEGSAMSRPFGLAILFAGVDNDVGPSLYFMDPSGTYVSCEAKAIGSGCEGAQQSLQESYNKVMCFVLCVTRFLLHSPSLLTRLSNQFSRF